MRPVKNGNTYTVVVQPAVAQTGFAPNQPRRVLLILQNKGINPCSIQFGKPIDTAAEGLVLAANQTLTINEPCPPESISAYSVAGTSLFVYEGVAEN